MEENRKLQDGFGRTIDYLRISVTDRCNLRCTYCMPEEGVGFIPHEEILRYEEIIRLSEIFVGMGIRKIRVTGGEPLVRKNILFLTKELSALPLDELVITTNGVLLEQYAEGLKKSGIRRVNVSLDSMNEKTFRSVTRRDRLADVMRGIEAARQAGLGLKINVVAMRGINDAEVTDFVRFALEKKTGLRFIEVMPQYYDEEIVRKRFLGSEEILAKIAAEYEVVPKDDVSEGSVERLYSIGDGGFRFGVISAISDPFCKNCNRVRMMANGVVKTCLFGPEGPNLKRMLLRGAERGEIERVIQRVVMEKPKKHTLDTNAGNLIMNRVGG
ncbi:MAG: GTP 3',8-cyclase MoaA [Spirochaetes bacterium]|nr:GTP 3',8-cyclase MoaA [Spirochaetota bacterium]